MRLGGVIGAHRRNRADHRRAARAAQVGEREVARDRRQYAEPQLKRLPRRTGAPATHEALVVQQRQHRRDAARVDKAAAARAWLGLG